MTAHRIIELPFDDTCPLTVPDVSHNGCLTNFVDSPVKKLYN